MTKLDAVLMQFRTSTILEFVLMCTNKNSFPNKETFSSFPVVLIFPGENLHSTQDPAESTTLKHSQLSVFHIRTLLI